MARATIEVFVTSASSQGFLVQPLPPEAAWTEASINHHAAPLAVAGDTKTVPAFAQQTWVSVDVTDLVTGDGVYGFALSGISRTAVSLGSRESDRPPRLTIEVLAAYDPNDGPSSSRPPGASRPQEVSTHLDTGFVAPDVMTGGVFRGGDKL